MSIFQRILVKASGNFCVQKLLEKNVKRSQNLMGIGSGGKVSSSGEKVILDIINQRIQPPYCIFDIGSNRGQFLKLVLENISTEDFSIHCFEPGRETYKLLLINSKKDNRIKLNNLGLGREKSEAVLHYNFPGSSLASLTKRKLDHLGIEFNKFETISIDSIDNYCLEHEIEHINLLKIDIEGHELDVFAGASNMFDKKAIDIVTFEFGGCNIDTRSFFQDFWYFFLECNMKLLRITPSGYLFPIKSYNEIYEQFRTTNFIALKND